MSVDSRASKCYYRRSTKSTKFQKSIVKVDFISQASRTQETLQVGVIVEYGLSLIHAFVYRSLAQIFSLAKLISGFFPTTHRIIIFRTDYILSKHIVNTITRSSTTPSRCESHQPNLSSTFYLQPLSNSGLEITCHPLDRRTM